MAFLQAVLYGFVSGFSEFTPISSHAHQTLALYFIGTASRVPLLDLLVHLGALLSLFWAIRTLLVRIRRDKSIAFRSRKRKGGRILPDTIFDLRVVRTSSIPMIALLICMGAFLRKTPGLVHISVLLIVNGIFLFITDYVHQGNKDARMFTGLDALVLGFFCALGGLPGISRIGTGLSFSIYRGANKQSALRWALLLSIPALILMLIMDLFGLFASGGGAFTFTEFSISISAMIASFIGGLSAISLMRYLSVSIGFSAFAFYSWGLSLFNFIIYLLT